MSHKPDERDSIQPSPLVLLADPVTDIARRQLENVRTLILAEAELKAEVRARTLRLEQLRLDRRRHCSILSDIEKEIKLNEEFFNRIR
jgi:hypothetical protein